jgi:hypothetical protein
LLVSGLKHGPPVVEIPALQGGEDVNLPGHLAARPASQAQGSMPLNGRWALYIVRYISLDIYIVSY